jgi:hypothetical protein
MLVIQFVRLSPSPDLLPHPFTRRLPQPLRHPLWPQQLSCARLLTEILPLHWHRGLRGRSLFKVRVLLSFSAFQVYPRTEPSQGCFRQLIRVEITLHFQLILTSL